MNNASLFANLGLEDLREDLEGNDWTEDSSLISDVVAFDDSANDVEAAGGDLATLENLANTLDRIQSRAQDNPATNVSFALESVGMALGVRYLGATNSMEGLKEMSKTVWEYVKKIAGKIVELVADFFRKLFGSLSGLEKKFKAQKAKLKELEASSAPAKSETIEAVGKWFIRDNKPFGHVNDLEDGLKATEIAVKRNTSSEIYNALSEFYKLASAKADDIVADGEAVINNLVSSVVDYEKNWYGRPSVESGSEVRRITSTDSTFGNVYTNGSRPAKDFNIESSAVEWLKGVTYGVTQKDLKLEITDTLPAISLNSATSSVDISLSIITAITAFRKEEAELKKIYSAVDRHLLRSKADESLTAEEQKEFDDFTKVLKAVVMLLGRITTARTKLIKYWFNDLIHVSVYIDRIIKNHTAKE